MSPRVKNFNTGSIIYFEHDKADCVFLLKEGKVNLVYDDITTKEKIIDTIAPGEFFGVKSGLIKYPREETAQVVTNSVIFEFPASEFETLIMKNTQIILKILKVFSNQLRKVGKQVQSLVSNKAASDPSDEFFQIGEYYLKNKKNKQALTVYKKYLHYYPDGKFASAAAKRLKSVESLGNFDSSASEDTEDDSQLNNTKSSGVNDSTDLDISKDFSSMDDDVNNDDMFKEDNFDTEDTNSNNFGGDDLEDIGISEIDLKTSNPEIINLDKVGSEESKIYYKAISFMTTGKYLDAFNTFKKVLSMNNANVKILASYEIGKCYFFLEKYDKCIEHLTKFISKHSRFTERLEVLFFIGNSYLKTNEKTKALKVFKNILTNSDQKDPIYRKTKRAVEEVK